MVERISRKERQMTLIKGVYIPADETQAIEMVEFDRHEFSKINEYTGTDCFSGMDIFNPDASIFYDDDGKVLDKPLNRRATLLWWVGRPEFVNYDALLGDVLILGPADGETGETTSAPQVLIDLLFNTTTYKYQVKTINEEGWHGNQRTFDDCWQAFNDALALSQRWTLVERVRVIAA